MGTPKQWQLILGVVAAVCAYLLIQTDVALEGWAKVLVGAVSVGVAVLRPGKLAGTDGGE